MSILKMWRIFEKTGNIEAYLYDKMNKDTSRAEGRALALKDDLINPSALKQKDGTEG